jgi:hypothetical protein
MSGNDRNSAIHISGDGMIETCICDVDIAIFHPGLTEGSNIFIEFIDNALVQKRIEWNPISRAIVLYNM